MIRTHYNGMKALQFTWYIVVQNIYKKAPHRSWHTAKYNML